MILCISVRVPTLQEAVCMGSHSKTNRAVQRLRRLARRRREAGRKKDRIVEATSLGGILLTGQPPGKST